MKIKGVLFLYLLYSQCCAGRTLVDEKDEVIYKTTVAFAERYNTRCNIILHSSNETWTGSQKLFRVVKLLAMDINAGNTVTSLNFALYLKISQNPIFINCPRILFIVFGYDEETRKEFSKFSYQITMGGPMWLIFFNEGPSLESYLEEINLPFNNDLVAATILKDIVEMKEAYRVSPKHPTRIKHFGRWSKEGFESPKHISICFRRLDLEGIVLKAGIREDLPMTEITHTPSGEIDPQGYFGLIWKELQKALNFSTTYTVSKYTGIKENENGTWNGMVGLFSRNEIDVGITPFTMTVERIDVMDFTRPLYRSRYQVYIKQPGNLIGWDSIFRPFTKNIWIVLCAWLVAGSTLLAKTYSIGCYFGFESQQHILSLGDAFFTFLRALCQQGSHKTPNSLTCRIIYILGYFMSTILLTAYSAYLVSYLAIQNPIRPFDSLKGLLDDGTYQLQMNYGTAEFSYFSTATDPLLQEIYQKLVPMNLPTQKLPLNSKEALNRLCHEYRVAVFTTPVQVAAYTSTDPVKGCTILGFTKELSPVYYSLGFSKNSHFRDIFNHKLLFMMATGSASRLELLSRPLRKIGTTVEFHQIEAEQVIQIQCVLLLGISLSLVILALEYLQKRIIKKSNSL